MRPISGICDTANRPSADELIEARAFGEAIAARVAGAPYVRPPLEPKPPLIYRLERILAHRWLIEPPTWRVFPHRDNRWAS